MVTPRKQSLRKKMQGFIGWTRAVGLGSTLLGGIMLTQSPSLFPFCVLLVYFGLAVIAFDLLIDPFFEGLKRGWKVAVVGIVIGAFVGFTWFIVLKKSPLQIAAFMTDADYPKGSVIAGIQWRPEFTEVQVSITNGSPDAYDDLNIVLRPTMPVAAISQITTLGDVSFEEKNLFDMRYMSVSGGQKDVIPRDLLATDAGYRVRCTHLPAHAAIRVVLALVDMKWPAPLVNPNASREQQLHDPNFMVRTKTDKCSTYWWGNKNGDVYAPRVSSEETISIEGEYIGGQRIRKISDKITVGGRFTISH